MRVAVVGGGIVGLATAFRLQQRIPGVRVTILEKERAGDTVERAETYLRSVVAGSAPADRSTGYLRNVTSTVEMLRRTTPIRLAWAKDYSDYHPEEPGGTATGRTCECQPLNSAILGQYRTRLRPG